jgi:hypothetical protein
VDACTKCGRTDHLIDFCISRVGEAPVWWAECSECQMEVPLTDNLFERLGAVNYKERTVTVPIYSTVHNYSIDG